MKLYNFAFVLTALVTATGCASTTTQPPVVASSDAKPRCESMDTFDKAGDVFAAGGRVAWDKSKGAWVWLTSEENKDRAVKAWESAKNSSVRMYQLGKEYYRNNK